MAGESQDNAGFTCWGLTPHKFTSVLSVHHKKTGSRKDLAARLKSNKTNNKLLTWSYRSQYWPQHGDSAAGLLLSCLMRQVEIHRIPWWKSVMH